jgi:hypothetical protein
MNLHRAFNIYNYNKPIYSEYIKTSSYGRYIEKIIEDFNIFFHNECIKHNPDMKTELSIVNLSQMITDDHIKHIIQEEEFPDDLEEQLFIYFQEKWIVRLSLQPIRHLIGKILYPKYQVVLESYQQRFNNGLTNDLDDIDSVGSELFKYITETLLCMHTYYGNVYHTDIKDLVRVRFPHIIGHSYTRTLSEYSFIHNDNGRSQLFNIIKAYYLMFQIKATIIQRYWRSKYKPSNSSNTLKKRLHEDQEDCSSIIYTQQIYKKKHI